MHGKQDLSRFLPVLKTAEAVWLQPPKYQVKLQVVLNYPYLTIRGDKAVKFYLLRRSPEIWGREE